MMTYQQFRRFGYLSRLHLLRCGPSGTQQQAEGTQVQVSQEQLQLAQQQQQQSQQQYQQMQALEAPYIAKETALASGDRAQAIGAAMPTISAFSQGFQGSKEQILNSVPPGPGRDAALAQLQIQSSVAPNLAVAQQIEQAPGALANVGAGLGAFSLQEVGAALSGFSGANTTATGISQEENQAQANKYGLISGLAGAAGSAVSGTKLWSDARLKTNVQPLYPILDKLLRVNVVRFDYKSGGHGQIGVIAQNIQKQIPECVEALPDPQKTLMVDWAMLAACSLKAVQELAGRVEVLERQLAQERKLQPVRG